MSKHRTRGGKHQGGTIRDSFADDVLTLFEDVREGGYDARSEIELRPEFVSFLNGQGLGRVARTFRGEEKSANAHDSAVILAEKLVMVEQHQPRNYSDTEIVSNFWRMMEGKEPQRPQVSRVEHLASQALKRQRREEKAAAKAAKAAGGVEGGFVGQLASEREAETDKGQGAGRY